MSIKVVADFRVLMRYAKALGEAKKSGDADKISEAQRNHDAYATMCLRADSVNLGVTYGSIY